MPHDLLDRRLEAVVKSTVWLLPALYVLSPRLNLFGPSVRLGDFLVLALVVVMLVRAVRNRSYRTTWMDWIYVAFGVSMVASIIWSYVGLGLDPNVRDFFEFPKFALFWAAYAVTASVSWRAADVRRAALGVLAASGVVFVVSVLQYYDVLGVNDHLTPLYASALHTAKILTNGRVTGTLDNPNYLAFVMLWPLGIGFVAAVGARLRRPLDRAALARGVVAGGLALTLIGMAASRTALGAAGLALLMMALPFVRRTPAGSERADARKAVAIAAALVVVAGLAGIGVIRAIPSPSHGIGIFERILLGFGEMLTPEEIDAGEAYSFRDRMQRWDDAADEIADNPLLGRGPAKTMVDELELPPTDNEYLYHAQRYGLAGLAVYLALYLGLVVSAWRRTSGCSRGLAGTACGLPAFALGVFSAAIAFNVMAGTLYNLQVWPLIMFTFGVLVGATRDAHPQLGPARAAGDRLVGITFAKQYPNPAEPLRGLFIRQQVEATADYVDWTVVAPVPLAPRWLARALDKPYVHQEAADLTAEVPVHRPRYPVLPRRLLYTTVAHAVAWSAGPTLRRLLRDERPDFVHAHALYPSAAAAARVLSGSGVPLVVTVHGSDLYSNLARPAWRRALLPAVRTAALVVCVSERLKADVVSELGVDAERVVVVPDAYDEHSFSLVVREHLAGGPLRLLSVGRLEPVKGYDLLVDAVEHVVSDGGDVTLTIVGAGSREDALRSRIADAGLDERVTLTGALSGAELAAEFEKADAFVSSSRAEGFGVAIVEALATGLPVLATRAGGPEDIVGAEDGILVEPDDVSALAEGITRMLERLSGFDPAGIAARTRARYGSGPVGRRLGGLYARVAGAPHEPARVAMFVTNDAVSDPRVNKEAKVLASAGYDVAVFAWDRGGDAPPDEIVDGVRYVRLGPRAPYGSGWRSLPLFRSFWRNAAQAAIDFGADAVHCHDLDTAAAGLEVIDRVPTTRLVLDLHELYRGSPMVPQRGLVGVVARAVVDAVERRAVRAAALVIVANPGNRERYESLAPEKVRIVENAPDAELFAPAEGDDDTPFTVCFIGKKRYRESLARLVRIAERNPDIAALIAGGGPAEDEIARLAESVPNVTTMGQVAYADIPGMYADCDLVYALYDARMGNIRTSFPVKAMEAMACGLPCIVDDGTWVGEFVEREGVGLAVDSGDEAAIEAAIARLRDDPEEARAMGAAGRRVVEQSLSWAHASGRLVGAYAALMGARRS